MSFDIVICYGPNDSNMLDYNLLYNKKNIIGYNKIYVITHDKNLIRDDCIIIHESIFPFNIDTIKSMYQSSNNRYGWYLQQLLKLYASIIITEIVEHYLVIDCDTLFLQPTTFFENDLILYNTGNEYHEPYFSHISRMTDNIKKEMNISGICHHMMFSKTLINEMFTMIENEYNEKYSTNYVFYEIFLSCINGKIFDHSGASEYEMYFNYLIKYHLNKIKIRQLKWSNISGSANSIDKYIEDFSYISLHWYCRS